MTAASLCPGDTTGQPRGRLDREAAQRREQDEYLDAQFVSPVLLADPSPYQLYSASLTRAGRVTRGAADQAPERGHRAGSRKTPAGPARPEAQPGIRPSP